MRQLSSKLIIGVTIALLLWLNWGNDITQSALASIHRYDEPQQQVLIRSLNTLKDKRGNAWQAIFFKRTHANRPDTVSLRLVGFPGKVAFIHPQFLHIETYQGQQFEAEDLLVEQVLTDNVGQFDLTPVLPQIPVTRLKLSLPLADNYTLELSVPPSVVLEWQDVVNELQIKL
jgi:hypothetical protein